jgi:uncharacterized protein YbjT (DUF2867 family)
MSRLLVLGAAGSLGRHLTEQAIAAHHDVSVLVRTPSKMPDRIRERVAVLVLANLAPAGEMSRHRVGMALPAGMRGKKDHWAAGRKATAR